LISLEQLKEEDEMKLFDAIQSGSATKHVDEPVAGTHLVSKANLSAGFYKDFKPDDSARRSNFNTSYYYGWGYPGADPLGTIASFAGDDGWEPQ
jgi:hypothetical protein